jgi:hypothetical protein
MKKVIQLTESQLADIIKRVINESEEEKYEKGPSGMRAARSKADYTPTPKESDIMSDLFGKYKDDIPPIVVRYLRKLGKETLTKRLIKLGMIDKSIIGKDEE